MINKFNPARVWDTTLKWGALFFAAFAIYMLVFGVGKGEAQTLKPPCISMADVVAVNAAVTGTRSEVRDKPQFIESLKEYLDIRIPNHSNSPPFDKIYVLISTDGIPFRTQLGPAEVIVYRFYKGCYTGKVAFGRLRSYQDFVTSFQKGGA